MLTFSPLPSDDFEQAFFSQREPERTFRFTPGRVRPAAAPEGFRLTPDRVENERDTLLGR